MSDPTQAVPASQARKAWDNWSVPFWVDWGQVARWAFALALFAFLVAPLVPVIYQAFIDRPMYAAGHIFTLANFAKLIDDPTFHQALWNTGVLAIGGTALTVVLTVTATIILDRFDLRFRRTMKLLFLFPLFSSSLINAFAWSMVYQPGGFITVFLGNWVTPFLPRLQSLEGMLVVAAVSHAPLCYLFMSTAMANIGDNVEAAARASGAGPVRALFSITIPLMRPAIFYCVLLSFVLKVDLLAIPQILGTPVDIEVLSTYLYRVGLHDTRVDYGIVGATALTMLVLIQLFIFIQSRLKGDPRRYTTTGPRASRNTRIGTGRFGWIIVALFIAYCVITGIIPILFMVLRSLVTVVSPFIPLQDVLTLANYELIFTYKSFVQSIQNTFLIALFGSIFAVILTVAAVGVSVRSKGLLRSFVEQTAFLPKAVPGMIVGIGLFYAATIVPGASIINGTLVILALAFTIRFFATGFSVVAPRYVQIGEELENAVRTSGGSVWTALRFATLPLLRPAIWACYMIYFAAFFKEYAAASFLYGPNTAVVGTTMLSMNTTGNLGAVAALGSITLLLTAPIAVWIYGREA